ncbi:MAG: putative peptidase [uncultured marine phage]|uniref:Putative peptidase n=1 Tax=uncultured marine phage TaxID=707152 RepID=A0A8D9FPX2_9VIRU|nr:MAG: putative peptidase [uncultured marine phage]
MNIRETFLNLTTKTYPHGTEHLLEDQLPKNIQKDKFGNYFHVVGDGSSRVIFASHLDTVSGTYVDVTHTFTEDGKIVGTDGNTTLGADDKAGVTIMLYMIEKNVPGLYYFFVGEEVGCIGSGKVSRETQIFNKENYDKVISFDRRGNTSVITHQSAMRCCSDSFANTLCDELNGLGLSMETDDTGVCTDSIEFMDDIPECTNLSVGYMDEHTGNETQDLDFLERMSEACSKIDWDNLPTERDPSVTEYKTRRSRSWSSWNNNYQRWGGPQRRSSNPLSSIEDYQFVDEDTMSERERYSLTCAYYDEYEELSEDYGSDNIAQLPEDTWHDSIIDIPNIDNGERCFYPGDLYEHRDQFFDNLDSSKKFRTINQQKRYFEAIRDKYLDDRLSDEEILRIKDQLLDLDDPVDAAFAEDIDSLVTLKNWQ